MRTLAAIVLVLLAAGIADAQKKPKVVITGARTGLPPGAPSPDASPNYRPGFISKFATWAPIYLEIEVNEEIKDAAGLTIETPDGDEVGTKLTIPFSVLASAKPGQVITTRDLGLMPYVRAASGTGETVLRLRSTKGNDLADPYPIRSFSTNNRTYVVLSLGSKLPGFDLPKEKTGVETESPGFRKGHIQTAAITDVGDLPDRWFGYDAADLVVLTTGTASDAFLRRLFSDRVSDSDRTKRDALLEWIRRGGRLVVTVGSNAGLLAQLPAFRNLMPFDFVPGQPTRTVPNIYFRWYTAGGTLQSTTLTPKSGSLSVAALTQRADRSAQSLLDDRKVGDATGQPLVVQSSLGLGRLSLIAFDLDRPPFTEFDLRPEFWDWVLRECGASRAAASDDSTSHSPGITDEQDELSAAIRTHVDTFEGVPVISFGWVAVFIVLYILVIGPAEYFFLKKVLGRLELTWITFPIIVLSVSAAAYFTAYAVKGRDMRVNKVDIVDIDPASGTIYGQTWFTVFSPRIDTYTVTVSPAAGWTSASPEETAHETLTGWVSGTRGGRASLVRRSYRYHVSPDGSRFADALEEVPIQVWSTKTFSAKWAAPLDATTPVVEAKLEHPPGDASSVTGTIVNRMPLGEIRDVVVIYAGKAYPTAIGSLVPGVERRLVLKGTPWTDWLKSDDFAAEKLASQQSDRLNRNNFGNNDPVVSPSTAFPMLSVLFHEKATSTTSGLKNASLRSLDQSWRLNEKVERRNEVIVVGRVAVTTGPAEETLGDRYSPSQLWLKGMPGDGKPREPIRGAGRQETYVRMYLPVK